MANGYTSMPGTLLHSGPVNTRGTENGRRPPVAADFAFSAGFGSTASAGTIVGSGTRFSVVLTSAGTGQGANPTCTYTIPGGAFYGPDGAALTPVVIVRRSTLAAQATVEITYTVTATTVVMTFAGTPVDTETYPIVVDIGL